ncbi:MAG: SusC/RagA family TonB-linked outer membrane protein [Phocaeicola sp.]
MNKRFMFVRNMFIATALFSYAGNAIAAPEDLNHALAVQAATQQTIDVKVKVFEEDGVTPVIGATVVVVGTTNGALTDFDGIASIPGVSTSAQLEIKYVGLETQLVKVNNRGDIVVVLKQDALTVDEIVVVGYGTQKKANLTGSVATVNQKAIENRPLQSVSQALQGQIPGVVAVQNSGRPGSQTASITIRGKNTINAGGPFVIIDGIPGDMNNIDPNDVESISVLKDAASSAIYGVQAANGVILITTKRGKSGQRVNVNYTGSFTVATPTVLPDYLGSYDYAVLYNESQRNQNPNITDSELRFKPEDLQKYKDGSSPYTHADTDWYDETFKRYTAETQHYMSISGGSDKTVYSGSLGLTYQDGNTSANDYSRNNMRFNVESEVVKWFKVGMNLSGYISTNNMGWDSPESLRQYTNRLAPIYSVFTDATESDYFYAGMANPVATMELQGSRKYRNYEYTANTYAQINFLPNLSLRGVYANRGNIYHNTGFQKAYSYGGSPLTQREGYDNSQYITRETIQALLNYNESFGKHDVAFLGGYEQYLLTNRFAQASRTGGGNNDLSESLNTLDPANQFNQSGGNDLARLSYFGRIQYAYADKYLFEANLRADASSRFPAGNRWGYFPSFSAAWRISQEKFMQNVDWLSNLKLRLGYGQTGNEEIDSNYASVDSYGYSSYIFGDAQYATVNEARYVNRQLSWATVTNYEAAIEAGFLQNKLSFELAYYRKETSDMLLRLPVPSILGASAPQQNAGAVRNTGFDLNINYNDTFDQVKFTASANIGYTKNEITELRGTEGADPDNSLYWFIEGESIGSFYGYKAIGLFRDAADVSNSALRTGREQPGDIKYEDLNGDGAITGADRMVIGKNYPSVTAGLTLGASWKNFDFQMFFQGVFDVDAYLSNEASFAFFNSGKVLSRHLDRWTPDNLDATYPRITNSDQINFETSSYWLQDASYVRLKNLTLGYTLPKKAVSSLGLQNIRVYFSGENLLTFTGMDDWDPEIVSSGRGAVYGNVKKYSLGLKVGF